MKKFFMNLALIATAGILMVGCGESSGDAKLKKDIVGKYSFEQVEADKDMEVVISGISTYNADGTTSMDGSIAVKMELADMEALGMTEPISLKYALSVSGKYDIKDSFLIYTWDMESLKMEMTEGMSGEAGEFFDMFLKPLLDTQLIPSLKQEMLRNPTEKIVEINEERMILDTQQGQMVYDRVK